MKKAQEEFDILRPNKYLLDEEWVNQPKMVFDYIVQLEAAREKMDEAKTEMELVYAECDKSIRANPNKYDLPDKLTETLIKNTIMMQSEYQKAREDLSSIKHKVGVLGAAVTAMEHRKKALENLVILHSQNYFSTPKAHSENTKQVVEEMTDERLKKRRQNNKIRREKI